MKSLPPILLACLSVLACSVSQLGTDVDRNDAGSTDVEATDVNAIDANASDISGIIETRDAGSARPPLCDGVQHLRLAVAYVGGGQQPRGYTVTFENGYSLFAIDGTCSFWIAGGWTNDSPAEELPVRTGKLSDADARLLGDAFPLGDIGGCSAGLALDAPDRVIRTEAAPEICGPLSPEARVRFDAAWMTVQSIAPRLWADGTPTAGALHVSAVGPAALPPSSTSPPAYAWPIALPLDGFVLDSSQWYQSGVSRLVDDPDAARQLRGLRDQYLADRAARPGLYSNWDGLITTDPSITALVYMRDAIPYEDASGLLRF